MQNSTTPVDQGTLHPEAKALVDELEAIADSWLAPYVQRIQQKLDRPSEKILNDLLWGSIRLFPWEVALVDSPLMQRLRGIRQLGVLHWVYPNAGHSRFEHSLGVLHTTQTLLDGIERSSGLAGARLVDDVELKLLRIAALVHDCGHVAMSHVGEEIVEKLHGVAQLQT